MRPITTWGITVTTRPAVTTFSLRQPLSLLLIFTLLLGGGYPLLVGGFAAVFHKSASNEALVGQQFTGEKYFWGRPSATTPPYNAMASGASQLGPTNPDLKALMAERIAVLEKAHGKDKPVPVDLVTASGSGLDPDISVEAAKYQVARVAAARGMNEDEVQKLVAKSTKKQQLGFFGKPRVNVLKLNQLLDSK